MSLRNTLVQNLEIETIRECNAKCTHCPRQSPDFHPGKKRMDDDLLKSILDQIVELGPRGVPRVCPFGSGEPLLDPRIPSVIRRLNEDAPWVGVTLFTNGSLFTKELLKEMEGLRIQNIFLSVPTLVEEDYHKITGLNLEKTFASIDLLIEAVREYSIHLESYVYLLDSIQGPIVGVARDAMIQAWNRWPIMAFSHSRHQSFLGLCPSLIKSSPNNAMCWRIHDMIIHSDGRVPLCCQDVNCTVPLGELRKNTLIEIIHSPKRIPYQLAIQRNLSPCNKCNIEVPE